MGTIDWVQIINWIVEHSIPFFLGLLTAAIVGTVTHFRERRKERVEKEKKEKEERIALLTQGLDDPVKEIKRLMELGELDKMQEWSESASHGEVLVDLLVMFLNVKRREIIVIVVGIGILFLLVWWLLGLSTLIYMILFVLGVMGGFVLWLRFLV